MSEPWLQAEDCENQLEYLEYENNSLMAKMNSKSKLNLEIGGDIQPVVISGFSNVTIT